MERINKYNSVFWLKQLTEDTFFYSQTQLNSSSRTDVSKSPRECDYQTIH
jgi:hypothetical protein